MFEENQSYVSKTSQQSSVASGPQRSILDYFKSPAKGNASTLQDGCSSNYVMEAPLLYEEKTCTLRDSRSLPSPSSSSEIISNKQTYGESGDCSDVSPLLDELGKSSAEKKKKCKNSKTADSDRKESVEMVFDSSVSELLEPVVNQPVSHSLKKKKSRNGHDDKSGNSEAKLLEPRDSCTGECLDTSNLSRERKHNHKRRKLRRKDKVADEVSGKRDCGAVNKEKDSIAIDIATDKKRDVEAEEIARDIIIDDVSVTSDKDIVSINEHSNEVAEDNADSLSNSLKYKKHKHKKSKSIKHKRSKFEKEICQEMGNVREDVFNVSDGSSSKQHKKSKTKEVNNVEVGDPLFSEEEKVFTVSNTNGLDKNTNLDEDKECRKIKKAKRKKNEWGFIQHKNSDKTDCYNGEREMVSEDIDSKEVVDLLDSNGIMDLQQKEIEKLSANSMCVEQFKSPKKAHSKRKLQFNSDCDKGCQVNKKHKKKRNKKNAFYEDDDNHVSAKAVLTMTYDDYLKTLVSTVDSSSTSDEMSSGSNLPDTKSKTEVSVDCSSSKQEDKTDITNLKGTPSIMNFFTKKSESKSSEESCEIVVKVDVHDVPSKSPVVKQLSVEEKTPPREKEVSICELLASSSPCLRTISDKIEFLGSVIADETSGRRKKGKLSCSLRTQTDYIKPNNVHLVAVKKCSVLKKYKKIKHNSSLKKKSKLIRIDDNFFANVGATNTLKEKGESSKNELCLISNSSGLLADKSVVFKRIHNTRTRSTSVPRKEKHVTDNKVPSRSKSLTDAVKTNSQRSQSTNSEFELGAKLVKSQELLHKATKYIQKKKLLKSGKPKIKMTKKKEKHNGEHLDEVVSNDESGCRRSQRLAALTSNSSEESVIEIDEEENVIKPKEDTKKLSTKSAASPRKKKAKPTAKLAPIFMNGGKTIEASSIQKPPEDPEKAQLRKAFLMSGIPEKLKQQASNPVAVVHPEFAPLPTVSHVQQRDDNLNFTVDVWRLPAVNLRLRPVRSTVDSQCNWSGLEWKSLTCRDSKHMFKNFASHKEIPNDVVVKLIEEMKTYNVKYPFDVLFKEVQTKRQEDISSQRPEDQRNISCQEVIKEQEVTADEDAGKQTNHKNSHKETGGHRRKPRSRLTLTRTAEDNGVKTKPSVSRSTDESKHLVKDLIWTDRYQPRHSSEVIGHSKNLARMKSWLLEWKHRTALEERKVKKRLLQQCKKKCNSKGKDADVWDSDNSDFDIDSGSSDSEADDRLCNSLLITGPTGIGKTASVYALAQELGYKVIEVNPSSSRNGKRILSQLQEATQSHQVAQSKEGITPSWINVQSNSAEALQKPPDKAVPKLPTAFANLFQKAAAKEVSAIEVIDVDKKDKRSSKSKPVDTAEKSKDSKRKRAVNARDRRSPKKAKKDETSQKVLPLKIHDDSSQTGSLNLSSTTLILFDEADVYFDDLDKGFLSAVQHFMDTAKIPIILTTSNSSFSEQLHSRHEQLTFKPPSSHDIVSHLQTLCLADSVRTDYHNLASLVQFYDGDIRKCMLALQLWVESGGDPNSKPQPISTGVKPATQETTLLDSGLGNSHDTQDKPQVFEEEESEFATIKRSLKRKCSRIIYDDDTNCNPFPVAFTNNDDKGKDYPFVNRIWVERLMGAQTGEGEVEDSVQQYLQGLEDDMLTLAIYNLKESGINVVYDNMLHLLPLPKICLETSSSAPSKITASRKKFKTMHSDIYDTEASPDSLTDSEDEMGGDSTPDDSLTKEGEILVSKSLHDFANFYNTMCLTDIQQAVSTKNDLDDPFIADYSRGNLSCIMDASVIEHEHKQWSSHSMSCELQSEIELRSAKKFCNGIEHGLTEYKKTSGEVPDIMHLPVPTGRTRWRIQKNSTPRMPSVVRKARHNVTSSLPLSQYCHPQVVSLDYMPTLRSITRAEQQRQVAKAKRRFHHYFNHIGLLLKESTMNSFLSTF